MSARVALILLWVTYPLDAMAYLDAGSASILFQAAAASIFTGLFVLKTYWANVRAWVSGKRKDTPPPEGRQP